MSQTVESPDGRIVVRDGLVIVADLSKAIGMDRSNLMKLLKRRGVTLSRRRSDDHGGQLVSVVAEEDARSFLESRRAESLGSGGQVRYLDTTGKKRG